MLSISDFVPDMPLGSRADWLAAIGTTAAFVIAAVAFWRDVRMRQFAQARLVHADLSGTTFYAAKGQLPGRIDNLNSNVKTTPVFVGHALVAWTTDEPTIVVRATVHNGSDEILGEVLVRVFQRSGAGEQLGVDAPAGTVKPGSSETVELWCAVTEQGSAPELSVGVTFRDSAGRWWRRRDTGPVRRARRKEFAAWRAKWARRFARLGRWFASVVAHLPASVRKAGLHLRARWDAGKDFG